MDENEISEKDRERANELVVRLLRAHAGMFNRPNQWSKDDGAKDHYYGLRNEVERLLVVGVQEDKRRVKQDWISVEERLPEPDAPVLGWVRHHGRVSGYSTCEFLERRGDTWYNVNESGYPLWENEDVTHWMPLPDPPATE